MLIDTHAHINFNAFKDDSNEVIKRALGGNVWLINVGSQYETSERAIECAQKYASGVFAAVGLHPFHLVQQEIEIPIDVNETVEFATREEMGFAGDKYKKLAQNEKVVAIGEAGLDYHYLTAESRGTKTRTDAELINLQKEVFKKQIELAMELNKPLIIHCREAHEDVIEILRSTVDGRRSTVRGVIHSFSGRWSQAEKYLAMGFYLGFNGIITFARDYDRVVREMPLDRLVLETDCPYLTPLPFRGQRNEPSYVKYVAEKVAELRGISFDEVAGATTNNAKALFNFQFTNPNFQ